MADGIAKVTNFIGDVAFDFAFADAVANLIIVGVIHIVDIDIIAIVAV